MPDRREGERLAREVVERCRGRGWIFTDIGLNEQGEEYFSFTHRSFLEYFAAQHLVRTTLSSTELARELLPYILSARGEILASGLPKPRRPDNGGGGFGWSVGVAKNI